MRLTIPELKTVISEYVTEERVANTTFNVTRNNTAELIDKIAKTYTIDNPFYDKLAIFDGEELSFGKTVEEWYQNLVLPVDYDENGEGALAPTYPNYVKPTYSYTIGKKVIPITIRNNDLERAVHFIEQFRELIDTQTKRMYDSLALYKYGVKKQMLSVLISLCEKAHSAEGPFSASEAYNIGDVVSNADESVTGVFVRAYVGGSATTYEDAVTKGYIVTYDLLTTVPAPVDATTGENFIEAVKKDIETASFANEGHSLNGNTIGSEVGLVLLVKKGVVPALEVKTIAGAFHDNMLAVPAEIVVVDDFGDYSGNAYAVLMDRRGMRLHNTYQAVRENFNGKGDFLNLFLHTENTPHISRNTFVKVYKGA